jgi:hypothetical protein
MLGRYEEALGEFELAASNNPFGPDQTAIINVTDMLVALGHIDRATAKARDIVGPYAQYAAMRLASIGGQWRVADSLAARALVTPGTSPGFVLEATTMRAGMLAVHGAAADADASLAAAAAGASGAQRRWYEQVRTLLALTTGRPVPNVSAALAADTTPAALVVRGARLALRGDTAGARVLLDRIDALPGGTQSRLAGGPAFIGALIDGAAGRWAQVVATLGPAARAGEHDAADLDRLPSIAIRWVVADAYAHMGQLDSASAMLERGVGFAAIPPGHLALRAFALPYGERRLATWATRRGDTEGSRRAWAAFQAMFTTPDLPFRSWRDEVPNVRPGMPNATPASSRRALPSSPG